MKTSRPLISVNNLRVGFPVYGGVLRQKTAEITAVDNISFSLNEGETLGIVGESGSGKTTVGRAIANLIQVFHSDVNLQGTIQLNIDDQSVNLNGLGQSAMKPYRHLIQMIFQDPYSSLNPRLNVREILERPLKIQTTLSQSDRLKRIAKILDDVGLQKDSMNRYPHEFSGGQRQRIGIARALTTRPKIIIADEPVSALDVSVQGQVINLMEELQQAFGLTYLFIAHDLSLVYHISDRIGVMYLGNIVELGDSKSVYHKPRHPYTQALLSAVPYPDPDKKHPERIRLVGDIPTPLNKPSGCSFHPRCPIAEHSCQIEVPKLIKHDGTSVACPYARS